MLDRLKVSPLKGAVLSRELDRIVGNIQKRSQPRAIILFGSAAIDALTGGSDIDLALIYETYEEAERGRHDILGKGPVSKWPIDFIFTDRVSFKEKLALGGVYRKIR